MFAACSGPGLSAERLKKLARARVVHVVVLDLGRFPSCAEIGRPPNESQLAVGFGCVGLIQVGSLLCMVDLVLK